MANILALVPMNAANFDSGNAEAGEVLTADGSGGAGWQAAGGGASYLVYAALLTQAGENAPVATVLENTLGGVPVWGRDGNGVYYLQLAGMFTENKTMTSPVTAYDPVLGYQVSFVWSSVEFLILKTFNLTGETVDGILVNFPVEIRVYP